MSRRHSNWIGVALIATVVAPGCGTRDRRVRGQELLRQASSTIAGAPTLSFSSDETTESTARDGHKRVLHTQRLITMRRPDRLWFKTSGDRNTEAFYDGSRLTLLFHGDTVFGVVPTPQSLDDTVQELSERYDVAWPIGDLLTSDPRTSYITSKTTGGWQGEERIDGKTCARLEWRHPTVDWTIWIPPSGEPLPAKLWVNDKNRNRTTTVIFRDWNLSPQVNDAMFQSRIPDDFEGVAVIQRASAVLPNLTQDTSFAGVGAAQK